MFPGRQVSPADPIPHTGGRKLDPKSDAYKTLVRWIEEGMVYAAPNEPKISSIEVQPSRTTMKVKTAVSTARPMTV